MSPPLFFYDFSSPYSYLTAARIDDVLPVKAEWQPIIFGGLMGAIGKVSWSLRKCPARDAQMRECEERAAELGLPLRWPHDWPFATYSTLVVRAALVADEDGKLEEFSRAAFTAGLGHGRDLKDRDVILDVAAEVGLDRAEVSEGVEALHVKERVREITQYAVELGVTGVPTIVMNGEMFWGDDQLDSAVRALEPAQA
jgi:2-hydroxychromene-2-carboxylate isomerase